MKDLSILVASVLLGFLIAACSPDAPKPVKQTFQTMFPDASEVEWEQDGDNEWEAEFDLNEMEYNASFSATGEWMETEYEIGLEMLPDTVLKVLAIDYEGYEIDEAEWIERADFRGYELALEKKGDPEEITEILINPEGQVVQDAETGEEDDSDEN